jgi:hypothetical protein
MSTRQQADRLLTIFLGVLFIPARLVEEYIHYLASSPWADNVVIHFDAAGGSAQTLIDFREGTPNWAVTVAYAAPEIVARVAGVAILTWWAISGTFWWPQTAVDFLLLVFLGAQYLAIALPSAADMDRTAEGSDG